MQHLDPQQRRRRLAELGFSIELFDKALDLAAVDVRGFTDLDAATVPGAVFWSRANRYLAEELIPEGWDWTRRDNILRTIHPSRSHLVTAISASGGVGDLTARVRTKNPKGSTVARVVEKNNQIMLLTRDEVLYGRELDEIPTWCLLYKRTKDGVTAELSLPIGMTGKYVDQWYERIPLDLSDLTDPGSDISLLDEPLDEPLDDPSGSSGAEVVVEYQGS